MKMRVMLVSAALMGCSFPEVKTCHSTKKSKRLQIGLDSSKELAKFDTL